ncbi:PepSY domain-containing protein [Paracraurococcus lichenis]|uniref:PepSY domain-containing protein n=1 Tax=Paracraurococcus lichenis TaxID=3064888 RepID=A0ABT9EAX6_9PROT|nr:PepSY domain-containing protein [Paracraurococcus sp. LOR1-02]MDO9713346.1 PepSY domain-containing protein [Paracraurococcus sp. LOR1-02]
MLQRMWQSGAQLSLLTSALVLSGVISVVALADDKSHSEVEAAPQALSGTVAEVFGKHFVLMLESGRRILVEVPRRDVIVSPGERIEVTGSDEEGEFEASRLVRGDGSVVTEDAKSGANRSEEDKGGREGSPATARVGAAAAIAASERAGYPVITELEWEDGAWEVEALNAQGRPAKLRVDASTGEVTPIEK